MMNTLPVGSVAVRGEIGRRIDRTIRNNMLAVDIEGDFLAPFRRRDAESAYIGLGHFLDALTRFCAYREEPELAALRKRILSTLSGSREPDGYIGLFPESRRLSKLWDTHETSHLIYGLASDHRYHPDGPSLDLARGLAGWLIEKWRSDPELPASQFVMATLDLEPALLNLHAETADATLLDFCVRDRDLPGWNRPIIEGRWGRIDGHIYDYLSRSIAQLMLMRFKPAFGLGRAAQRAMDYMIGGDGMLVTGELGDHECWHSSQEGTIHLGETCATAYLIRMLDMLLRETGDPFYGDLIERALYNALFAAQSPDGRRIRYYTPIDGPRQYFGPDTYCCPNNFRRIMSELPGMICYETSVGLVVSLYTDSIIFAGTPGGVPVELRMKTRYPSDGHVEIEVIPERSSDFEVALRIPKWCSDAAVSVRGAAGGRFDLAGVPTAGAFLRVNRTWNRGDMILVDLPMRPRLVAGRKAQSGRFAVMRGPSVFTLSRNAREGLREIDLRLLVAEPGSVGEAVRDDTIRPDGIKLPIRAWGADAWYPVKDPELELSLTEFPDPDGEVVYLKPPIPNDRRIVADELLGASGATPGRSGVAESFYADVLGADQSNSDDADTLERLQGGTGPG